MFLTISIFVKERSETAINLSAKRLGISYEEALSLMIRKRLEGLEAHDKGNHDFEVRAIDFEEDDEEREKREEGKTNGEENKE